MKKEICVKVIFLAAVYTLNVYITALVHAIRYKLNLRLLFTYVQCTQPNVVCMHNYSMKKETRLI